MSGHSIKGEGRKTEHIDYEGDPLKIDGSSHVGFGKLGRGGALDERTNLGNEVDNNRGVGNEFGGNNRGAVNELGSNNRGVGNEFSHSRGVRDEVSNTGTDNFDDSSRVPRSMANESNNSGTSGLAPHKSSLLNKLDPRVNSNANNSVSN